jgi:hypothetical protein
MVQGGDLMFPFTDCTMQVHPSEFTMIVNGVMVMGLPLCR